MISSQVFISYSRTDETFAKRLQNDLTRIGLSVWMDAQDLKPGDSFANEIERAIDASAFFFLVLPTSLILSEWVEWEYRLALTCKNEKGKPKIIPIRLHNVEPPLSLRIVQYADFREDYVAGWAEVSKLFPPSDLRTLRLGGGYG